MKLPEISIRYPDWLAGAVDWEKRFLSDEEKIREAIRLSRLNVEKGTGGPFGAAVFDTREGRLAGVGVNLVLFCRNSSMHAETMALAMAQARVGSHSLRGVAEVGYELAASSEPCAMCLGATLWSGVSRVICGATGDDARSIGFDEGPVFPESFLYLEERGVRFLREVCRAEAREVLELYREKGGPIYN